MNWYCIVYRCPESKGCLSIDSLPLASGRVSLNKGWHWRGYEPKRDTESLQEFLVGEFRWIC